MKSFLLLLLTLSSFAPIEGRSVRGGRRLVKGDEQEQDRELYFTHSSKGSSKGSSKAPRPPYPQLRLRLPVPSSLAEPPVCAGPRLSVPSLSRFLRFAPTNLRSSKASTLVPPHLAASGVLRSAAPPAHAVSTTSAGSKVCAVTRASKMVLLEGLLRGRQQVLRCAYGDTWQTQ